MNCNRCGRPLNPGAKFCTGCGASLNTSPGMGMNSPPPPPPPSNYGSMPPNNRPITPPPPPSYGSMPPSYGGMPPSPPGYPGGGYRPQKSKTPFIIGGIAGVLAIIVIVAVAVLGGNDKPTVPVDVTTATVTATAAPSAPSAPSGTLPVQNPTLPPNTENLTPEQVASSTEMGVFRIKICNGNTQVGWGSGFFITSSGIAVTNHHVIAGGNRFIALLDDGSEHEFDGYYYHDHGNDIAVVQVRHNSGGQFQALVMGNSDDVVRGTTVYAFGGPEGSPLTFEPGMITRIVEESINYGGYSIRGMFQSSATLYGGNSGGPLINGKAEVIGVNSAGSVEKDNWNYAVPVNRVVMPSPGDPVRPFPISGGTPQQPQPPRPPQGASYCVECYSTSKPLCPGCHYCADCDWFPHCRGCGYGEDCVEGDFCTDCGNCRGCCSCAGALSNTYRFVNDSNQSIWYFYVSPSTSDSWGDDLLGAGILSPGGEMNLTLYFSSDRNATFDVMIKMRDDDSYTWNGIWSANDMEGITKITFSIEGGSPTFTRE